MKSLIALLVIFAVNCFAQEDFSSWRSFSNGKLIAETSGVSPGHKAHIGLWLKMSPDWHTYWVNPGDSGEPVKLSIKSKPEVSSMEVQFPSPQRLSVEGLTSFAYENEVLIPIEFIVPASMIEGGSMTFEVTADWLICQKVCIPAADTFTLSLPVERLELIKPSEHFRLFQRTLQALPLANEDAVEVTDQGETMRLRFPQWSSSYEWVDFYPYRNAGLKNVKAKILGNNPLELEIEKSNVPKKPYIGLGQLVMRTPDTNVINAWSFGSSGWAMQGIVKSTAKQLWWILLSAFIGGLILNSMPCVFPILSMKLISLVKLGHSSHREIIKQNLAYTFGVIVSFLAVALLILALRQSGQLVGWGFQLQSPVFVAVLVWLFILLALQLLGFFELDFLNFDMGHKLTRIHGLWGSFFTGVLAVVVASPCTAPFMGVAIGFALVAPWWTLLLIFLMLGLGLAFPYLLFAFFPPFARVLPKPGPWMKRFKEFMAFPLILTALWLLWLVGQLAGLTAVSVVLAGGVMLVFAVWLSKWRKKLSGILAAVFLIGCTGWLYQQMAEEPLISTDNSVWQKYSPTLLEKNKDRIIFVDMTADWCLACKVNERVVLDTEEIQNFFKEQNILLVKGDWTQRNPEITEFLNRFERAGVPFYAVFSSKFPAGKVLPEMLSKEDVKNAILEAKGSQ